MPRSVSASVASSSAGVGIRSFVERLEPSQDRRGGGERELLADHLQDERSPEVARQAVEEAVGVQARLRVDQVRHPRVRRAQQLPPRRPPVGAASR